MVPVTLEILKNAFTAIPEEMGAALKRTAYSPNIKERMDASCAIFDAEGRTRRRVGRRMSVPGEERDIFINLFQFIVNEEERWGKN
ncbi:MAG: hydantoinase B/oxoprolinase family protein [Methanophagales archaeon]|nr:hydantoinase B/oxoprolinase family protein [Methanophagales archaeon]